MCQWFAPTQISLTFEREGLGKFSDEDIAAIVERDSAGNVVALKLPDRTVLIANHQVSTLPLIL